MFIIKENYIYCIKMWFTLLILGITFFPLTSCIFKKSYDNGWIFSKIIGMSICGITMWILSYAKLLKFTNLNCYIIIVIFLLLNILIFMRNKENFKITSEKISRILTTEIIFAITFIVWILIKSYSPSIDHSTEQFMNYGFMNVIMNSGYMPAQDIWLSGYNINYYYFGQYISAWLTKVAFLNINEGYNVMLALVATFTFILPYSLAKDIGIQLCEEIKAKNKKIIPWVLAILTGLSISIGGTLYYPIYKWIVQDSSDIYHYTHQTRYIGYRPETNDKTITDIPAYSNVKKDLHAHYVDTMFAFTTLAILFQIMLTDKNKTTKERLKNPCILLLGLMLGMQKMTNYWDFPIYLVVIFVVIIANYLLKYKVSKKTIYIPIIQILEIILLEELITLPFTVDFYMSATKVYFTNITSPLYKFMVLWGFQIICVLVYLGQILNKLIKNKNKKLIDRLKEIINTDIYIILLGICAIGLVILPELVYVKDIYTDEYKRANTMFKLTYQAYILFSISINYIVIKSLHNKGAKKVVAIIALIIYITTFGYGINAIRSVIKDKEISDLTNIEYYIKENYPDDYKAINWIKNNIDRKDVILENVSGSYTPSSRISVFTANPTVLGWHGHEWVWRANKDYTPPIEENNRWEDIYIIYTSKDKELVKKLIKKYNISYIYIGNVEYMENKALNVKLLLSLGKVVYKEDKEYSLSPVYIVKVK